MSAVKCFEDLDIWKDGLNLSLQVYKEHKDCRDFSFRDQLQRSAISIPSNIAEGFERQTNKEFIQYLFIAKGSCGELRTQLIIALKLNIIKEEIASILIQETKKISAKIYKLIEYRKSYKT